LFEFDVSGLRLAALQKQFSVEGVSFRIQDQVVLIEVENALGKATISPFGATILQFQPVGEKPVLWQSPTAIFDGKKAIRGGIPVCWPWFGQSKTDGNPAHGFVRNRDWQISSIQTLPAGTSATTVTKLVFSIESDEQTLAIWPYEFALQLIVVVGKELTVELITENRSDKKMEITEALHSYFAVSEVNSLQVKGFAGSEAIDTLQQPAERSPAGDILDIHSPIDSVFVNQTQTTEITDSSWKRRIQIAKNGASSIVWNPGPEIVKDFSDIPDDAWSGYLCVEAGNVWDNAVSISAKQLHSMKMTVSSFCFDNSRL